MDGGRVGIREETFRLGTEDHIRSDAVHLRSRGGIFNTFDLYSGHYQDEHWVYGKVDGTPIEYGDNLGRIATTVVQQIRRIRSSVETCSPPTYRRRGLLSNLLALGNLS